MHLHLASACSKTEFNHLASALYLVMTTCRWCCSWVLVLFCVLIQISLVKDFTSLFDNGGLCLTGTLFSFKMPVRKWENLDIISFFSNRSGKLFMFYFRDAGPSSICSAWPSWMESTCRSAEHEIYVLHRKRLERDQFVIHCIEAFWWACIFLF